MRKSVTYVRKTGLVEDPTKNHTARAVPMPASLTRLLEKEIAVAMATRWCSRRRAAAGT